MIEITRKCKALLDLTSDMNREHHMINKAKTAREKEDAIEAYQISKDLFNALWEDERRLAQIYDRYINLEVGEDGAEREISETAA